MKPIFGISIYPIHTPYEDIVKYLTLAKEYNFTKLFTSLFYVTPANVNLYIKCFELAKKLGFYIIADIGPDVIEAFNDNKHFAKLKSLGIDCLRLDTPLAINEIVSLTHSFDIQINASFDNNLFDQLLMLGVDRKKLSVMHNFYPRKFTGLGWSFFNRCNNKWFNLDIDNGAFISSQSGYIGQQPRVKTPVKLPTIEQHRYLPIVDQAKQLFLTNKIKDIFIGNYPADENEFKSLAQIKKWDTDVVLNFRSSNLTPSEKQIVLSSGHYRRGDLTDGFIRSVTPRITLHQLNIPLRLHSTKYKRGDVLILNNNDDHYKCEL
jgi:hypothetical protein